MESVNEEEEVYSWREVSLPALSPTAAAEPELERETGERRRGRDILIAVDHGPNSKHAFDWALIHLCRLADTIHLVHAVSSMFKFYPPFFLKKKIIFIHAILLQKGSYQCFVSFLLSVLEQDVYGRTRMKETQKIILRNLRVINGK